MNVENIKRLVLSIVILVLGVVFQYRSMNALEDYDYTLVTFDGGMTWEDSLEINKNARRIEGTAAFSRSDGVYIFNDFQRGVQVTLYTCSESYFDILKLPRISGRFLWDGDSIERRNVAVIDENLATHLFAGKDCIGEKILVNRTEYEIVGVCGAEDGVFTSVDEYAIYLPLDSFTSYNTMGGCLLRSSDDISVTFALQRGILSTRRMLGAQNLDMKSNMWSMTGHISQFLIFLMALVFVLSILYWYAKLLIKKVRQELQELFFIDLLKQYRKVIILHILGVLALVSLYVLWFRAVSFTLILDPDIIPSSLIDIGQWIDNLQMYSRAQNSTLNIPLSASYQVSYYGSILLASSLVCLLTVRYLLFSFVQPYIDTLKKHLLL